MTTEKPSSQCPECGATLSPGAAMDLCARCLMMGASEPTQAGVPPSAPPSLEQVAGAFPQLEVVELIGCGGMGAVYKVRQPKLDRFAALKLLPQSLAADPAFASRFEREARLLARLNHANIVAVYDHGQQGPFFYVLMEYVDGVNLRQAMQSSRFTPAQALAIVPKICEALQYAHEEGVLHRDVKPENILLDARGRVKLADFGIAKLMAGTAVEGETRVPGALPDISFTAAAGTPAYMAPEQQDATQEVDQRADIYSLGVVFFELLTGELPKGVFSPPSAASGADPRVDEIVRQALQKDRQQRQQSAAQVKTQVENIGSAPVPAPSGPGVFNPRLPLMAKLLTAYGLFMVPALWITAFIMVSRAVQETHYQLKMLDAGVQCLSVFTTAVTCGMMFAGALALRGLSRSGRRLLTLGLALDLLNLGTAIYVISLRLRLTKHLVAQGVDVLSAGHAGGAGLAAAAPVMLGLIAAVFEAVGLVWLLTSRSSLDAMLLPASRKAPGQEMKRWVMILAGLVAAAFILLFAGASKLYYTEGMNAEAPKVEKAAKP